MSLRNADGEPAKSAEQHHNIFTTRSDLGLPLSPPHSPQPLSTAPHPGPPAQGRQASFQYILHTAARGVFSKHTALFTSNTHTCMCAHTHTHMHACEQAHTGTHACSKPQMTSERAKPKFLHVDPGLASPSPSTHNQLHLLSAPLWSYVPGVPSHHKVFTGAVPCQEHASPDYKPSWPLGLYRAPSHLIILPFVCDS